MEATPLNKQTQWVWLSANYTVHVDNVNEDAKERQSTKK